MGGRQVGECIGDLSFVRRELKSFDVRFGSSAHLVLKLSIKFDRSMIYRRMTPSKVACRPCVNAVDSYVVAGQSSEDLYEQGRAADRLFAR